MRGSIIQRGGGWSVVLDLGEQPAWRCASRCTKALMWQSEHPSATQCSRCGEPLTAVKERRRQWHSGYATKRAAEQARTQLLHAIDTGTHVDPSRLTLEEYLLEVWLPARRPKDGHATGQGHRGQVSEHTWHTYKRDLERMVIPRLGQLRLQGELKPVHLSQLYDHLETDGAMRGGSLSTKTIANLHGVLHKALADAVKLDLVARNVADAVDAPRPQRSVAKVWTVEELRAFLAHVKEHPLFPAWLLFATTGMRRGEVAGLIWDDIDLAAGTVRLEWTLGEIGGKTAWKVRPKSKAGRRTMSLDPATVDALKAHRALQHQQRLQAGQGWDERGFDDFGRHRSGIVFRNADGTLMRPDKFSKSFRRLRAAAQVPAIRLHDVRHTYATAGLANATGWHEVKVISERLGHASVGFTVDTYSHVLPARDRETADTLARIILGGTG